jgi:hypothetical protein
MRKDNDSDSFKLQQQRSGKYQEGKKEIRGKPEIDRW